MSVQPDTTDPTTSTTAAPSATTTSIAPSGTAACTASDLTITLARYQGAAGTGYYAFDVTNDGVAPCQLSGYFGVSIYGTQGQELTDTATRESTTLEGQGPTSISVPPNGTANFVASVVENGTSACTPIGSFQFIPPNTTSALTVKIGSTDQGGYCGSPQIDPIQAGSWSQG